MRMQQELEELEGIMSDDPMIIKLEAECAAMNAGMWREELGLQQLLEPSKVVNTEREIMKLRASLESEEGLAMTAEERLKIEEDIEKKEAKKNTAMRGVMQDWLKAVFFWQSWLAFIAFGFMANGMIGGLDETVDLVVRLVGFWGIWAVTVPGLRARKPGGFWGMSNQEKTALDISFLVLPFVNIGIPPFVGPEVSTPDLAARVYWANVIILAGCYAFGFAQGAEVGTLADAKLPEPIKFVIKALDFGAGQERGVRADVREKIIKERQRREEMQEAGARAENDSGDELVAQETFPVSTREEGKRQ
jgi:hypothetical protein